MKAMLCAGAVAGLIGIAARAHGEGEAVTVGAGVAATASWGEWSRPLSPAAARKSPSAPAAAVTPIVETGDEDLDVVDAHWMALTMWGEARGQGEEAMRAVGHVIDNRRRTGGHGAYVTETVSEAWQFSCWNEGDPNRAAMLGVLDLPEGSREHRMWLAARRIADEILAGRSDDPTGGALFYHTDAVAPSWSRGIEPVRRIGGHLFFRAAARA